MSGYLKTNTAVKLCVGPFLDKTDGVTPETSLTVANSKITLIAETDDNNLPTIILDNVAGNDATNTLAHITNDDAGYYSLLITAANVNRLGRVKLAIVDAANHCPVFHEYMILPANVYDSIVLGTDYLDISAVQLAGSAIDQSSGLINANVKQISADATAADNAESFFDGTGYAGTGNTIPTVTTVTNAVTAGTVSDKTGYSLSSAYDPAKTAAQSTDARFDYLDGSILSRFATTDTRADYLDIAISSRAATTDTRFDYLNASIASRLPTSDYTAGSVSSSDIWGYADRTLTGQSAVINVVSPVATGGNINIIAGDSYKAADGRALSWSSTSWFDLTNQTLAFTCADVSLVPTFSGVYPAAQTVSLDMASSDTTAIKNGISYGSAAEFRITAASTDTTAQIRTLVLARVSVK